MTRSLKSIAVAAPLLCLASVAFAQGRSFSWYGEVVAIDQAAKAVTVKARIQPAAAAYLKTYKPGDKLVLTWDIHGAKGGEADTVLAVATPEEMKAIDVGYITRVELVSADAAAKTITFKTSVPNALIASVAAAQPGKWIKVTAPMAQPGPENTLASAALADAAPTIPPRPKPESAGAGGRSAGAAAVQAKGGISGKWVIAMSLAGNDLKNQCDLAQDGQKLGGICKGPAGESPVTGVVNGPKVNMSFAVNFGGMELDFTFAGTLDAAGSKIAGTVTVFGMESEFSATKN